MSAQRLEANQAIAKRKTGPRTELGKARSKMNAVKHGSRPKQLSLRAKTHASLKRCERGSRETSSPTP